MALSAASFHNVVSTITIFHLLRECCGDRGCPGWRRCRTPLTSTGCHWLKQSTCLSTKLPTALEAVGNWWHYM